MQYLSDSDVPCPFVVNCVLDEIAGYRFVAIDLEIAQDSLILDRLPCSVACCHVFNHGG